MLGSIETQAAHTCRFRHCVRSLRWPSHRPSAPCTFLFYTTKPMTSKSASYTIRTLTTCRSGGSSDRKGRPRNKAKDALRKREEDMYRELFLETARQKGVKKSVSTTGTRSKQGGKTINLDSVIKEIEQGRAQQGEDNYFSELFTETSEVEKVEGGAEGDDEYLAIPGGANTEKREARMATYLDDLFSPTPKKGRDGKMAEAADDLFKSESAEMQQEKREKKKGSFLEDIFSESASAASQRKEQAREAKKGALLDDLFAKSTSDSSQRKEQAREARKGALLEDLFAESTSKSSQQKEQAREARKGALLEDLFAESTSESSEAKERENKMGAALEDMFTESIADAEASGSSEQQPEETLEEEEEEEDTAPTTYKELFEEFRTTELVAGNYSGFLLQLELVRLRVKAALAFVDDFGSYTVVSSVLVVLLFVGETIDETAMQEMMDMPDMSFLQDMMPPMSGVEEMMLYKDTAIREIEDVINTVFVLEYILRWWTEKFSVRYAVTPLALVDLVSVLPQLCGFVGLNLGGSQRQLRLLRVLRLLRLLNQSPESVIFGLFESSEIVVQLFGIGIEFLCVFIIAAGVQYDLEYAVNPAINDLGDCLYWAFCTLTGIGQPFEAVTLQGRVATVLSILTALVVVPLQLTKVAAVGMQRQAEGMAALVEEQEAVAGSRPEVMPMGLGMASMVDVAQARRGGASAAPSGASAWGDKTGATMRESLLEEELLRSHALIQKQRENIQRLEAELAAARGDGEGLPEEEEEEEEESS